MLIEFYGGSDDLVEIRVNGKDTEEYDVYSGDSLHMASIPVTTIGGARGICVHAVYDGCWSFSVGQIDEGRSIPSDWKFSIGQEHNYSTKLTVDTGTENSIVFGPPKPKK